MKTKRQIADEMVKLAGRLRNAKTAEAMNDIALAMGEISDEIGGLVFQKVGAPDGGKSGE